MKHKNHCANEVYEFKSQNDSVRRAVNQTFQYTFVSLCTHFSPTKKIKMVTGLHFVIKIFGRCCVYINRDKGIELNSNLFSCVFNSIKHCVHNFVERFNDGSEDSI